MGGVCGAQQPPLPLPDEAAALGRPDSIVKVDFTQAEALFHAVRLGDVLLLRARWLMARAGYMEEYVEVDRWTKAYMNFVCSGDYMPESYARKNPDFVEKVQVKAWVKREEARALPHRQEIEAHHPEAIMGVDELERSSSQNRLGMAAVISVSHCWETPQAPDPDARTLQAIAAELAGGLDKERDRPADPTDDWEDKLKTSGLPLYAKCGFEDLGIFFDHSSLYQKPRTAEQDASFQRALARMSMWYCSPRSFVYIMRGQDDYLRQYTVDEAGELVRTATPNPRAGRGWPTYEEKMSYMLKQATRSPDGHKQVVQIGDPAAFLADTQPLRPPMAPSRFATLLQELTFTNGSDRTVVHDLYGETLREGTCNFTELSYAKLEWQDADVEQLGATILEVGFHGVHKLDLSRNPFITLPEAICHLKALRILDLSYCRGLITLPDAVGTIATLEEVELHDSGVTSLPEALTQLPALRRLSLENSRLTSLPDFLGQVASLRYLSIPFENLSALPDLSKLGAALEVPGSDSTSNPMAKRTDAPSLWQPWALREPWHAGGRVAFRAQLAPQLRKYSAGVRQNSSLFFLERKTQETPAFEEASRYAGHHALQTMRSLQPKWACGDGYKEASGWGDSSPEVLAEWVQAEAGGRVEELRKRGVLQAIQEGWALPGRCEAELELASREFYHSTCMYKCQFHVLFLTGGVVVLVLDEHRGDW